MCGPCWAEHGGEASASEIGPAPLVSVPSRDPLSQAEWLQLLEREPWFQQLRRDARRRLRQLAECLRNWADWTDWTCRPTWPELCSASEWARSTMAGWLRQLRLLGWLSVVEPGSTPEHRPMGSPAAVEGNRAAVYALRVPMNADEAHRGQQLRERAADPLGERGAAGASSTSAQVSAPVVETWTPSLIFSAVKKGFVGTSTRASELFHSPGLPAHVWWNTKNEALRARFDQEKRGFQWCDRAPGSRAEMYAAACELRRQHPILARLTPRAVRAVARPYWAAGWANDDVLHGLAYRPTSRSTLSSPAEYAVIHPAGWCRSRLAAWRDDRDRVLTAPRRREAEQAEQDRALRARVGRAGARLLQRDVTKPLVQHVVEHGQRCARRLADEQAEALRLAELDARRSTTPPERVASTHTREAAVAATRADEEQRQARRRAEALQRQLVEQANTYVTNAAPASSPTPPAGTPNTAADEQSPYERAAARARAEGRTPRASRRRRPRW